MLPWGKPDPRPVNGTPLNSISPESGCSSPMIILANVVLPEPDSPTIPKVSPAWTRKLMSSAAWVVDFLPRRDVPKALRKERISSTGTASEICRAVRFLLAEPARHRVAFLDFELWGLSHATGEAHRASGQKYTTGWRLMGIGRFSGNGM